MLHDLRFILWTIIAAVLGLYFLALNTFGPPYKGIALSVLHGSIFDFETWIILGHFYPAECSSLLPGQNIILKGILIAELSA